MDDEKKTEYEVVIMRTWNEAQTKDFLNEMAKEGWTLITVDDRIAYLERLN